jgi:hypothetical protein
VVLPDIFVWGGNSQDKGFSVDPQISFTWFFKTVQVKTAVATTYYLQIFAKMKNTILKTTEKLNLYHQYLFFKQIDLNFI